MCDTCGCNVTGGNQHLVSPGGKLEKTDSGREAVTVLHDLLHENDHTALHNREHFNAHGVVAINLMSSPGAGKTSLLEAIYLLATTRSFRTPRLEECSREGGSSFYLRGEVEEDDERRNDGDGDVAVVADPEDRHPVDDDVADRAAAHGRHQGQDAKPEDIHALARCSQGAADSKSRGSQHFEAVDEAHGRTVPETAFRA